MELRTHPSSSINVTRALYKLYKRNNVLGKKGAAHTSLRARLRPAGFLPAALRLAAFVVVLLVPLPVSAFFAGAFLAAAFFAGAFFLPPLVALLRVPLAGEGSSWSSASSITSASSSSASPSVCAG